MRIDTETQAAFEQLQVAKDYALKCARALAEFPDVAHLAELRVSLDIEAKARQMLTEVVACTGCRTSSSTR